VSRISGGYDGGDHDVAGILEAVAVVAAGS
jgi:hypothetical protein